MRRPSATSVFYGLEFAISLPSYVIVAVYLVTEVGLSPLQLVLVGTVMEVSIFLFEIPTGAVADTYGRKLSLIVSFLIQGAAWMLVGAVSSFWVILVAWALWGFGETFMSGAFEAWITDEVGADQVGLVLLRGTRISYLGALIGLGVGVAVAAYDLRLSILLGGAVVVGAGLACIVLMPETGFRPRPRELGRPPVRELAATARDGARFARGRPLVLLLLAVGLFVGAASESFDRLWEAHFIRDIGLPSLGSLQPIWWFGLFGAGMLLAGLVASTVMIRRFERGSAPALARVLFVLTLVEVVALITFGLAGGIVLR